MQYIIRTISLAFKSLLLHKLRSALTMLGIVVGVWAVIAMVALGEGVKIQAQAQVLALGATNIIVRSIKPPEEASTGGSNTMVSRYGITRQDHAILSKTLPSITGIVALREIEMEVRNGEHTLNSRIVGCSPEYFDMNHLTLARGRFLSDEDIRLRTNNVVIAHETAQVLFPIEDPLGKSIQVNRQAYRVIGVMRDRTASAAIGGSLSGQDYNKDCYIPLPTFQSRINTSDLIVKRTSGSFSAESVVYNQLTMRVSDIDEVLPTSEVIKETMERTHGAKRDYAITVPLELLKQAEQFAMIFNVVFGVIAGLSLVVGGIGIMNIMLATVTERTREIGIRRALGARRRDIIQQFITETIALSGTGGVIGLVFGLLVPVIFRITKAIFVNYVFDTSFLESDMAKNLLEIQPQIALWSLPVAFGFSVLTGVVFGVYPAWSAAKLDPIEALRHV